MAKRKSTATSQKKPTAAGAGNRVRTRERREERERKRRQRQMITLAATVVAVVVIAIVLIIITSQPAEAPIPEAQSVALYDGLQRSTTDEGFARLGNPDAPVTVKEYSSFDCTHCASFHEEGLAALLERVRSGDINFVYVPLWNTGSLPNGEGAARAAICAGDQGKFWEMHDALFSWHVTFGNQAFQGNRIAAGVENMGLDRGAYESCRNSSKTTGVMEAAVASTQALGTAIGTPSFTVNSVLVDMDGVVSESGRVDRINAAVDQALALVGPQQPVSEITPEVTPEVTDEPTVPAAATAIPTDVPTTVPETTPEATEAAAD